ncbi:MAG: YbaK/EbsC family protein [Chloroflexota bacterium]
MPNFSHPDSSASATPPCARASPSRSGVPDSFHTAAEAAATVARTAGDKVKSLVVSATERGPRAVVALVSGSNRVDVRRLAAVTGLAGLRRASAQEASEATGFDRRHPAVFARVPCAW